MNRQDDGFVSLADSDAQEPLLEASLRDHRQSYGGDCCDDGCESS